MQLRSPIAHARGPLAVPPETLRGILRDLDRGVPSPLIGWRAPPRIVERKSWELAAPTFQAAGTVIGGAADQSPSWPAHAVGDIGILLVGQRQVGAGGTTISTLSPASGFARGLLPTSSSVVTNSARVTAWWCRATSTSMSAPTVLLGSDLDITCVIITFRGCITTGDPTDVSSTGGGESSSLSVGSATTTGADRVICAAGYCSAGTTSFSAWASTAASGFTERADGNGTQGGLSAATGTLTSTGAYGTATATISAPGTWAAIQFALLPEPTAVGGGDPPPRRRPIASTIIDDPRFIARVRAQASDRPRDMRLLSRVHAPDGYGRGEVRSHVGSGYLTDVEAGTTFTPYAELAADMSRLRPVALRSAEPPPSRARLRPSAVVVPVVAPTIGVYSGPDPVAASGGTSTLICEVDIVTPQSGITIVLLFYPEPYDNFPNMDSDPWASYGTTTEGHVWDPRNTSGRDIGQQTITLTCPGTVPPGTYTFTWTKLNNLGASATVAGALYFLVLSASSSESPAWTMVDKLINTVHGPGISGAAFV